MWHMQFVFRVDSSHHIGTGHVMRCMVLANALRQKGHAVTFICRELPGNTIFALKNKNFPVISLPYDTKEESALLELPEHQQWLGVSRKMDLQQTFTHLSMMKKIDWLVVDHYGLNGEWEAACRSYAKKIMVIDDLADRVHDCDILMDQNYYTDPQNRYKGLVSHHCKTLIGPQYALLRSEFNNIRKNMSPRNGKVRRLMISLGGIDAMNGTRKILEGIKSSDCRDLQIDVVLGATSQHKDDIQVLCSLHENYHFHCPSENMAELMKKADLAIGAGGTTTWERCCMGLPSLVVRLAHNQDELIKQGVSANLFAYLGNITLLDEADAAKKLNEIVNLPKKLQAMSKKGMDLVDGLGAERVVDQMLTC